MAWIHLPKDRPTWICAAESGDSLTDCGRSVSKPCASLSAAPSANGSSSSGCEPATSTTPVSGTASKRLMGAPFVGESTSSPPGYLASPILVPVTGEGKPTSGTSGPTREGSYAKWDRDTCCWRTCLGSLGLMGEEPFGEYLETFPTSGLIASGSAFLRRPLAPRTSAIASGLLPTPRCAEASSYAEDLETWLARGKDARITLPMALRLLPTPATSWTNGRGEVTVETWDKRMAARQAQGKQPFGEPLHIAVRKLLPTATKSAANGAGHSGREGGLNLQTALATASSPTTDAPSCNLLNPEFVGAMMGYPRNWTRLRGSDSGRSRRSSAGVSLTVVRVSRDWGTLSFHKFRCGWE